MSEIIFNPEPGILASATLPDGRDVYISPLLTQGKVRLHVVNPICRLSIDEYY